MFQSILRPLSCSVDKQFLFRLDPKFLSSLGSYPFHLKKPLFLSLCLNFKKRHLYFRDFKRTSVQKSNKNEIFMARVKNSNCLKFCTQVDPCKTRKTVYFFSSNVFFFREKRM